MPLVLPDYLAKSAVSGAPVNHKWSQADAMTALGGDNPTVERKLSAVSFRGLLGLSAATAEWMYARFLKLNSDPELQLLIEAVWCASVDFRYFKLEACQFEPDENDPLHGPSQECKRLLRRVSEIYLKVDIGIVRHTRALANLVRYVLTETKNYETWFKATVSRLPSLSLPPASTSSRLDVAKKKTQPRGAVDEIWGEPLPREAFNPNIEIDPTQRSVMIDALLTEMSKDPNPFLRTPDELRALGFSGTPYRYPTI